MEVPSSRSWACITSGICTCISTVAFDEPSATWTLTTEDGDELRPWFVVLATGVLSVPYWPAIPGARALPGRGLPHRAVAEGARRLRRQDGGRHRHRCQRGAADSGDRRRGGRALVVYQRTPNWNSPLNNGKITAEEQAGIKATYDEIYDACMGSFGGFVHKAIRQRAFDVTREERWAVCMSSSTPRKASPSSISNYRGTMTNREANAEFSEFIAEKIRRGASTTRPSPRS